ncbi:MAG: hypothetical protein PBV01_10435 [Brucella anthropi]
MTEMQGASQKVVDSVIVTAISRLSMVLALPTIGLIFWLYSGWQDGKFEAVQAQINQIKVSGDATAKETSDLSKRLIAVETKQVQDAATSQKFQSDTLVRLDRVQDSLVGLSNAVAALTATLQGVVEDRRLKERQPR